MMTLTAGGGHLKRRIIMMEDRQSSGCGTVMNPIMFWERRAVQKYCLKGYGMMHLAHGQTCLSATKVRKKDVIMANTRLL